MEELFPIPSLPNYLLSKCGNVFSQLSDIYLNPSFRDKYLVVSVRYGNSRKTISIHRLVAETFIVNTENKPEVNHKNGVRTDNRVENLEWCTTQENYDHSVKFKLRIKKGVAVLNTQTGIDYPSIKKAAQSCGMNTSTLHRKLNGTLFNDTKMVYKNQSLNK